MGIDTHLRVAGLLLLSFPPIAYAVCSEPFSRPSYQTRGYYCQVGQLVADAYNFDQPILCENMEVDHLISLRQAWESGICGDDLKRFANDPRNLRFTDWRTNRSKGMKSPEEFASTLPKPMAKKVLRDASALKYEYKVLPKRQILRRQMESLRAMPTKYIEVPTKLLTPAIKKRITYKQAGGRTVVMVGKRVIGYAVGFGLAAEVLMISYWALDALTDNTEDLRRANEIRAILNLPLT